ncbi:hypothetical protein D3C75_953540 [compost metagenome]
MGDGRAGNVQRAFDGARGATAQACLGILGILQQVEEVLDAQPRHQQPGLATTAQAVEVVDGMPELVLADFQVFDQPCGVLQQALHDALQARAAGIVAKACGLFEELLYLGSVGNFHGHGGLPHVVVLELRLRRNGLGMPTAAGQVHGHGQRGNCAGDGEGDEIELQGQVDAHQRTTQQRADDGAVAADARGPAQPGGTHR